MTTIKGQLSSFELETRYEAAADPVEKSHFHALWLLYSGYEVDEVAEILSFSPRWVRALIKRYNEGGAEALGDQRIHNGTRPTILTPEALAAPICTRSARVGRADCDRLFDPATAATPS